MKNLTEKQAQLVCKELMNRCAEFPSVCEILHIDFFDAKEALKRLDFLFSKLCTCEPVKPYFFYRKDESLMGNEEQRIFELMWYERLREAIDARLGSLDMFEFSTLLEIVAGVDVRELLAMGDELKCAFLEIYLNKTVYWLYRTMNRAIDELTGE